MNVFALPALLLSPLARGGAGFFNRLTRQLFNFAARPVDPVTQALQALRPDSLGFKCAAEEDV